MTKKDDKEELIIRYFFGELEEEDKSRIEERFLTDNEFFEQMRSIEDALIDDYVRGQLPRRERRKVEEFLQSSGRLERETDSVKSLIGILDKTGPPGPERPSRRRSLPTLSGLRPLLSFALLLLAIISLGLAIWNIRLQSKLSDIESRHAELEKREEELRQRVDSQGDNSNRLDLRVEEAHRKSEQIEQEVTALKESRATSSASDTITLPLTMQAFTRGGGKLEQIRLGQGTAWLKLTIETGEEGFESFDAKIETFDGRQVWSKDGIRPAASQPGRIFITLPARIFRNEDYTLTLTGHRDGNTTVIGDFSFRIKE